MVEKLKQIDKKYLIVFVGIVGILFLIIIVAVIIKLFSGPGKNYESLENKLVKAAEKYISNEDITPIEKGEKLVITADTLIAEDYLKELSKYIDDTCTAQVTVMNNGGVALYIPDVQCTEYKTTHLKEKLIDDNLVVDSTEKYPSGLYEENGEYIFKGKYPNNYVSFGGIIWRILRIDSNGDLRVIKVQTEEDPYYWDTKYNVATKGSTGINEYETSLFVERITAKYSKFKDEHKKHLIEHSVCIGKRSRTDVEIGLSIDCEQILEKQYISTLSITEYALASLDENCVNLASGSCKNYNYLNSVLTTAIWTTTASNETTYQIYTLGNNSTRLKAANEENKYHWVIHISGEELYKSGTGSVSDPYIIE